MDNFRIEILNAVARGSETLEELALALDKHSPSLINTEARKMHDEGILRTRLENLNGIFTTSQGQWGDRLVAPERWPISEHSQFSVWWRKDGKYEVVELNEFGGAVIQGVLPSLNEAQEIADNARYGD